MSRDATPVPAMAARASQLSPAARQLHQAVLAAFIAAGQPPPAAELERLIRSGAGDSDRVRTELTEADLLAFTPRGEIRAAYPFSPAPTPIRVRWDGGPDVYAMCAIDALGMSAMLGRPVTASEPGTGRAVTLTVDASRARWAPRTAVVFAGDAGDPGCPSVDRCCGYISFFATGRAARAWARRHPEITGTVLRQAGALRIGIDTFGALLQPADSDEAETASKREPLMASVSHPVFARAFRLRPGRVPHRRARDLPRLITPAQPGGREEPGRLPRLLLGHRRLKFFLAARLLTFSRGGRFTVDPG